MPPEPPSSPPTPPRSSRPPPFRETRSSDFEATPPPGSLQHRRGSDSQQQFSGIASTNKQAAGRATTAAVGSGSGSRLVPLPVISLLLAAGVALLAAVMAWLLTGVFDLPPAAAAGISAAVALLAASVPTWAVALTRLRPDIPMSVPEAQPVHDSQTGAYRIDVFMKLAEREWSRARRYGTGAGLLVVDLDRATALHKLHGPGAAEAFLNALSAQIAPTLRGADLVTRLAPLQLGVFLAQADPTGALDVAERMRERADALALPWPPAAGAQPGSAAMVRSTVSVGVAALRPAHLNLQALVYDALDAVNAAHLAGGNCVRAAPVDTGLGLHPSPGRDDQRARPQP